MTRTRLIIIIMAATRDSFLNKTLKGVKPIMRATYITSNNTTTTTTTTLNVKHAQTPQHVPCRNTRKQTQNKDRTSFKINERTWRLCPKKKQQKDVSPNQAWAYSTKVRSCDSPNAFVDTPSCNTSVDSGGKWSNPHCGVAGYQESVGSRSDPTYTWLSIHPPANKSTIERH